jgi:hypothetical protein
MSSFKELEEENRLRKKMYLDEKLKGKIVAEALQLSRLNILDLRILQSKLGMVPL